MPLHANRIKKYGFNQSLEIAKTMAKELSIPLDKTSCMRIKKHRTTSELTIEGTTKKYAGRFPNQYA